MSILAKSRPSDHPEFTRRPHPNPTRRSPIGDGPGLPKALVFEPMMSIDDLVQLLNCSRRVVERMKSAGKLPRVDLLVGRMPRWKTSTIRRWIEGPDYSATER
jgi:hypothetical protein